MTCSVGGCTKTAHARGWCGMHYQRWRIHGDLTAGRRKPDIRTYVAKRVRVNTATGCWEWLAHVDYRGYGRISPSCGGELRAHRLVYELLVGPIPVGLDLDHICHSTDNTCRGGVCHHRRCVNPAHLEPVTRSENGRRQASARWTHCIHGHELTPENTYRSPSGKQRRCRTCRRRESAERDQRIRDRRASAGRAA